MKYRLQSDELHTYETAFDPSFGGTQRVETKNIVYPQKTPVQTFGRSWKIFLTLGKLSFLMLNPAC